MEGLLIAIRDLFSNDETIAMMVQKGVYYVPTIDHNQYYFDNADDVYHFAPGSKENLRLSRACSQTFSQSQNRVTLERIQVVPSIFPQPVRG